MINAGTRTILLLKMRARVSFILNPPSLPGPGEMSGTSITRDRSPTIPAIFHLATGGGEPVNLSSTN